MATLIYDVDDLQDMENDLAADYELANDIDASATSGWNDGLGFDPISYFEGTFDGKGYTITGLFINRPTTSNVGLFAYIATAATVDDVTLADVDITGKYIVGGLVGYSVAGTATTDCHVTGQVEAADNIAGSSYVGGLVGDARGDIVECSSSATITANGDSAGGLVGISRGDITMSYATGNVTGGDDKVGGFVGYHSEGTIQKCYATGDVEGIDDVGGFAGVDYYTTRNCYATGDVTGVDSVGGFVGDKHGGDIDKCYSVGAVIGTTNFGGFCGDNAGTITASFWDTQTSGQSSSDGGTGKTTAQMKEIATFNAWDILQNETSLNNGYPFLGWQIDNSMIWLITIVAAPRQIIAVEDNITLEMIRNVEMASRGKFYIDQYGKAHYDSRFARVR